uniref:Crumbs cell polarity complex component 2 n=1 Tax=Gouania willdenowi TaxID=441366 RepID=A0A8C5H0Y5_GOUWI
MQYMGLRLKKHCFELQMLFNCSVDIEECESEPCQNGAFCVDRINGYSCECPAGFLAPGDLPWGGPHCEVRLRGCVDHTCQNGATCLPWLDHGQHGHTCVCPHGFYDDQCSTPTTFSFSSPNFIHIQLLLDSRRRRGVDHQDHEGVGVQLRFRTTLSNMLLFFRGDADTYVFLEVVDGGLHAKAACEGSEWGVVYHAPVNDGDWQEARVSMDGGLGLVLRGSACDRNECEVVDDGADEFQSSEALAHLYVGGAPDDLLQHSLSAAGFVGCIEDLMIDFKPFLPNTLAEEQHLELGCSKTEWCRPDPCHGHGLCVDLWTRYQCDCQRPFHGDSCSEEYPSWTFSHEQSLSFSVYNVEKSHGSNFNISFLLRSLKPDGLLFQLRRPSNEDEDEEDEEGQVYFSIHLGMGRVLVSSLPRSPPLTAPMFVASGEKEFLQVEVHQSRVVFEYAGLRYHIGELPQVNVVRGDKAFVGGLPTGWDSSRWGGHFKGCLQDLRLDTVHLLMDQWNGLDDEERYVANMVENVKETCISDNTCKVKPCLNGGQCNVTFNDFTCTCQKEYVGKSCDTRVWCVSDPCVSGGQCVDLPDGYECVINATFENSPVQYSAGGSLREPVSRIYLELRTRSENAVLLRSSWDSDLLLVGLLDSSIHVEIHVGDRPEGLTFNGVRRVADGTWHRVEIFQTENQRKSSSWVIAVDGITDVSSNLEHTRPIGFLSDKEAVLSVADSFTGCLGAIRLGGVYLPFVEDLKAPQASQFHVVGKARLSLGCSSAPVCAHDPCLNGATCEDLFNAFRCVCDLGWEGKLCETDTDDCASQPCLHGTCRDFLAGFECLCHPGYGDALCDRDLNECEHHACEHGGSCKDGANAYSCVCPEDYRGPRCQWIYPPEECGKDVQCANDGICSDGLWGANCTCTPGFTGRRCETEIDECASNPCQNGGTCLDRFNLFVCECPPTFSGIVCDKLAQNSREGAYSPSARRWLELGWRVDSMLKVSSKERLI